MNSRSGELPGPWTIVILTCSKNWMKCKGFNTCGTKSSISRSFFLTRELATSEAKLVLRAFSTWRLCLPSMSNPLASSSCRLWSPLDLVTLVYSETAFRSRTVWLTFNWSLEYEVMWRSSFKKTLDIGPRKSTLINFLVGLTSEECGDRRCRERFEPPLLASFSFLRTRDAEAHWPDWHCMPLVIDWIGRGGGRRTVTETWSGWNCFSQKRKWEWLGTLWSFECLTLCGMVGKALSARAFALKLIQSFHVESQNINLQSRLFTVYAECAVIFGLLIVYVYHNYVKQSSFCICRAPNV